MKLLVRQKDSGLVHQKGSSRVTVMGQDFLLGLRKARQYLSLDSLSGLSKDSDWVPAIRLD